MNNNMQMNNMQVPSNYKPISMWGYFGYQLLFAIPCVGFICVIIFAFAADNVNVKNFARSYFCVWIIMAILIGILIAMIASGAIAYNSFS